MNMEAMIDKYFRPGRLPHIWCPGCGNGVVTGTIVKAGLQQPCLRLFRFQYRPFRTWTRFAGSDRR